MQTLLQFASAHPVECFIASVAACVLLSKILSEKF